MLDSNDVQAILELIACAIYGREETRRTRWRRNVMRTIFFGGTPVALAILFGYLGGAWIAFLLPWAFAIIVVPGAEYYLGRRSLAYLGMATWGILIAIAVATSVM